MTTLAALSVSPAVLEVMDGLPRRGVGMGHGYILLDDDVIAVTPPGRPRMPNGIETPVHVAAGDRVWLGGGELALGRTRIGPGPLWDPVPVVQVQLAVEPALAIDADALAGWGPGLTPLGDDLLVGYVAGLALTGHDFAGLSKLAARAGRRTTSLSSALLRHAAHGALPEPAHALIERGDLEPLLLFGATSGSAIAVGLAAAVAATDRVAPCDRDRRWEVDLKLPGGPVRFVLRARSVALTPAARE